MFEKVYDEQTSRQIESKILVIKTYVDTFARKVLDLQCDRQTSRQTDDQIERDI